MQTSVNPVDDTGGIFKGSGPRAAIRAATRNKFKSKIGELQFSLSRYEKLIVTVPIKNGEKAKFLLLLTFDSETEADSIILKRILPCVAENKEYFLQ